MKFDSRGYAEMEHGSEDVFCAMHNGDVSASKLERTKHLEGVKTLIERLNMTEAEIEVAEILLKSQMKGWPTVP